MAGGRFGWRAAAFVLLLAAVVLTGATAWRGTACWRFLFALAVIAAWMAAAWRAGLPPVAVGVATALAYGFGYTGHIARGFALAHLLLALLALAALEVWRRGARAERAAVAAATTGRRSADRRGADMVAPCSLPGAISVVASPKCSRAAFPPRGNRLSWPAGPDRKIGNAAPPPIGGRRDAIGAIRG